jgi:hypothetical protein
MVGPPCLFFPAFVGIVGINGVWFRCQYWISGRKGVSSASMFRISPRLMEKDRAISSFPQH